mmetsp:Transcript_68619/g.137992  ORF Transcript_68619/g.137992 Transcript_68619/m.137992 type:complete len:254 (-) Transcript_68619:795-1556(-)
MACSIPSRHWLALDVNLRSPDAFKPARAKKTGFARRHTSSVETPLDACDDDCDDDERRGGDAAAAAAAAVSPPATLPPLPPPLPPSWWWPRLWAPTPGTAARATGNCPFTMSWAKALASAMSWAHKSILSTACMSVACFFSPAREYKSCDCLSSDSEVTYSPPLNSAKACSSFKSASNFNSSATTAPYKGPISPDESTQAHAKHVSATASSSLALKASLSCASALEARFLNSSPSLVASAFTVPAPSVEGAKY